MKTRKCCKLYRYLVLIPVVAVVLLNIACMSKTPSNAMNIISKNQNDGNETLDAPLLDEKEQLKTKRYLRNDIERIEDSIYQRNEFVMLNYGLKGKGRTDKLAVTDNHMQLPSETIKRVLYSWREFDNTRIFYTERPISKISILEKIIQLIENGRIYRLACNEIIFSGAAFSLIYENDERLDLCMDHTGSRFVIKGSLEALNVYDEDKRCYYCTDAPGLGSLIKDLIDWEPFEVDQLKKVSKMVFIDKREVIEVWDKTRIQPIEGGLRKAKVCSVTTCPFDRYIQLHCVDGSVVKLVVAGDGCNVAALESTFYKIDKETIGLIHKLANDVGLDWWEWEFK